MIHITIFIMLIFLIAGIFFLQLLFGEYLLAVEKENMARRIMEYSDESIRQLKNLKSILLDVDDILARSLPPEEYESDELLDRMDQEKKQMQAEHIYLIAFLSDYYDAFSFKGIEFRCKLGIPEAFLDDCLEVLVLYDRLLTIGQNLVEQEMQKRLREEDGTQAENRQRNQDMIRIRESSQFGLWHLHMDVTLGSFDENVKQIKPARKNLPERHTRNRILLCGILRKHHLKLHRKCASNTLEIDIIT